MHNFFTTLFKIDHPEETVCLRGKNLIALSLFLIVVVFFLIMLWISRNDMVSLVGSIIIELVLGVVIWRAHKGDVTVSGTIGLLVLIFIISMVLVGNQFLSDTPYFMLIPIVMSGVILKPQHVLMIAFIALSALLAAIAFILNAPTATIVHFQVMIAMNAVMISVIFTCISYLAAHSITSYLARASALNRTLETTNAQLETQVQSRTAELTRALEQQQTQASELQASLDQQKMLSDTIAALSLPLIPVRNDVLVVPLIGNLNSERSQQLLQDVLNYIEKRRLRVIIIDVTGVALIDTLFAQKLLDLAKAARLLGAKTILVGIRPELAQTLVSFRADFPDIQSAATLQEALEPL